MEQTLTTSGALRGASRRESLAKIVDNAVFALSGVAAVWLAWLVATFAPLRGWLAVPFFIVFWLVLAYLVLPRIHHILTAIYVPDYFIGRARTSDGLLGDPVNLAAEGDEAQLQAAMAGAGWIRADEVTLRSSWRIITSTVLRRSYDEAPVSPLLLFGRQQDLAYQQEVDGNPAKRHHVRFWHCPEGWLLPGGHKVEWLAAGTFDRAVGFSLFTLQITHKIAADTDIERDHVVRTLTEHVPGVGVRTIKDFSTGYHSRNGGGDAIETDGDLPVVSVRGVAAAPLPPGEGWQARLAARERRRPAATTLGAAVMVLRAAAGAFTIAAVVHGTAGGAAAGDAAGTASHGLALSLGAAGYVAAAVYLGLAVLVFRGGNGARNAGMAASGALIVLAAVDVISGHGLALREHPFGLPLDILVLLALSTESASRWARARTERTGARDRPAP